jgi:glutathione S-transferase
MHGHLGAAIADPKQVIGRARSRPIHARIERAERLELAVWKRQLQDRPRQHTQKAPVAQQLIPEVRKVAHRFLGDVERRLEDREWIACADFTVADIMMASVLRGIRKTDLMEPFPRIKAYDKRCHARPAWQRTLGLYAERVGVSVDDIR